MNRSALPYRPIINSVLGASGAPKMKVLQSPKLSFLMIQDLDHQCILSAWSNGISFKFFLYQSLNLQSPSKSSISGRHFSFIWNSRIFYLIIPVVLTKVYLVSWLVKYMISLPSRRWSGSRGHGLGPTQCVAQSTVRNWWINKGNTFWQKILNIKYQNLPWSEALCVGFI